MNTTPELPFPKSLNPTPGRSRTETRAAAMAEHRRRRDLAGTLAQRYGGVLTLAELLANGFTRGQIRTEIDRGVWHRAGWHTVSIDAVQPHGSGLLWRALWESGRRSFLDGPTALGVAGLTGWREDLIHVSVPHNAAVRPIDGVIHHEVRDVGEVLRVGLRRTRPEVAAIRAAQWARSDRQAATIIAMTVQQRLTSPADVLARWRAIRHTPRRDFLEAVIGDVCNGAHSLAELDFARLCRQRGLPEPTRQAVRSGADGRIYLDAYWDAHRVHVEIQGAQHFQGTAGIDDALRFNDLGLRDAGLVSLQIPVLGLRVCPDRFLDQVERALAAGAAPDAA